MYLGMRLVIEDKRAQNKVPLNKLRVGDFFVYYGTLFTIIRLTQSREYIINCFTSTRAFLDPNTEVELVKVTVTIQDI